MPRGGSGRGKKQPGAHLEHVCVLGRGTEAPNQCRAWRSTGSRRGKLEDEGLLREDARGFSRTTWILGSLQGVPELAKGGDQGTVIITGVRDDVMCVSDLGPRT